MTKRKIYAIIFAALFVFVLAIPVTTFAEPPGALSEGWFSCVGGSFGEVWGCLSWFLTHVLGAEQISWY